MNEMWYYIIVKMGDVCHRLTAKTIKEVCPNELILAEDNDVIIFCNLKKIERILFSLRAKYRHEDFDKEEVQVKV